MAAPYRVGMITPSSNTALEPICQGVCQSLDGQVSVHFARIPVLTISLESDSVSQFNIDTMLGAARLLADARVQAIVWNGTSGAWLGVEADRRLCEAIAAETGAPASTSTLAQLEALAYFGVRRYVLATPYLDQVNEAIVRTFAGEGFVCLHHQGHGISENFRFNEVPRDVIRKHVSSAWREGAQAIVVSCTNYPAAWVVEEIEAERGVPVLDSTLAAVWKGLRLAGYEKPVPGWGRMLRV